MFLKTWERKRVGIEDNCAHNHDNDQHFSIQLLPLVGNPSLPDRGKCNVHQHRCPSLSRCQNPRTERCHRRNPFSQSFTRLSLNKGTLTPLSCKKKVDVRSFSCLSDIFLQK